MSVSSTWPSYSAFTRLLQKQSPFSTPIKCQPECRLLTLPLELRLEIYEWLFMALKEDLSAHELRFIATCRLIHQEVQHLAFQKLTFCIPTTSTKVDYHKSMMTLGPLSMHLRNVSISTTISTLDSCGGRNPFLLMKLPLDLLTIDFGSVSGQGWREDTIFWNKFMAAFLHCSPTSPRTLDSHSIHENLVPRIKRRLALTTWTFTPARADLYLTLVRCEAKEVRVMIDKDPLSDLLWFAFRKFQLVDAVVMTVSSTVASVNGPTGRKVGLAFYDTSEKAVMSVEHLPVESKKVEASAA